MKEVGKGWPDSKPLSASPFLFPMVYTWCQHGTHPATLGRHYESSVTCIRPASEVDHWAVRRSQDQGFRSARGLDCGRSYGCPWHRRRDGPFPRSWHRRSGAAQFQVRSPAPNRRRSPTSQERKPAPFAFRRQGIFGSSASSKPRLASHRLARGSRAESWSYERAESGSFRGASRLSVQSPRVPAGRDSRP